MAKNRTIAILSVAVLVLALGAITILVYNREQQRIIESRADGATSTSKLGLFVQGPNSESQKIIDRGPKVVKFLVGNVNDFVNDRAAYDTVVNQAKSYKSKYPQGKSLIRFYDFWQNFTPYDPANVPADDAAEEVFESYKPGLDVLRSRGDLKYFDYVAGPVNETERTPFWSKGIQNVNWLSRFWTTLIQHNTNAGIKTCAGNILTGDLPTDQASIDVMKTGVLKKLNDTGGVLCYHGYSDDGFSKDANTQAEHPLAYRAFYQKAGANAPQMVIGELGIVDGWTSKGSASQYEDWLTWYDSEIKKDPQIIGATVYQTGGGGVDAIDGPVASWLAQYLAASGGTGPSVTPIPSGANTQVCFDSCFQKSGNGSGCRFVCDNPTRQACFTSCSNQGKSGQTCIRECSGNITGTPTPGPSSGPIQVIEDTSPLIKFNGTWDTVRVQDNYNPRGGTLRQCRKVINADCTAEIRGISFDRIIVGAPTRPNGSSANVLVDNTSVGTISQTGALKGNFNNYTQWTKDVPCGTHDLKFAPNWQTGTGNLAFALDYVELRTCTPGGNVTPTPVPGATSCQGNVNAPAKCFSCRKDTPTDQLNILDFSCFSGRFGKPVE